MLLHLLFAHVVIQYSPVAKFKFVGSDAKDVRRENERRLTLVTMKLLDRLAPILAAVYVTFVFGNNEWDAVNQKNRILATLFDALDTILVGGSKIVEVWGGGADAMNCTVVVSSPGLSVTRAPSRSKSSVWRLAISLSGCDMALRSAATANPACAFVFTAGLIRLMHSMRIFSTNGSSSGRSKVAIA